MAKAVKLEDIAKRMGVSNVTVSKALSDKSGVSEELRVKIKQVAEEMGYVTISSQKVKERKGTGNIGILIPSRFVENNISFYWAIYQHVVTKLQDRGYYGILEILSLEDEDGCKLPKMIQDEKIDGLVMIGEVHNNYSEFLWNSQVVPMMFLDFYDGHMQYDTIISDGFYGMYILTNYLLRMGHEKIGFVGTPLATSSITDRYFGYQKALLEVGVELCQEWLIPDREIGGDTFDICLPEVLPTAFACNSDYTANEVINKLAERGLSVPEDISVVGFDNYLYPNVGKLQLTTYEVEIEKMAELCVRTLLRKISGLEYNKGVQIVTGQMVVKGTVKEMDISEIKVG